MAERPPATPIFSRSSRAATHSARARQVLRSKVHESPSVLPPPSFTATTAAASSPASAASSGESLWLPSRLPFRCSSVQFRGGPLLQPVEVRCARLHLDLTRGAVNLSLKWPEPNRASRPPNLEHDDHPALPTATTTAAVASSPTTLALTKKRVRADDDEDGDQAPSPRGPTAGVFHNSSLQAPANSDGNHLELPRAATFAFNTPRVPSTLLEQVPSSKRTRMDARLFHTPPSHGAVFNSPSSPWISREDSFGGDRNICSIPLSSVVGVDFAISLDTPPTCTFALKPHAVYASDPEPEHAHGHAHTHHRVNSSALHNLPRYSPARVLVASYESAAAIHPARFNKCARFVQRVMSPLLYWIWLHSTYAACAFLLIGCLLMHQRFWMGGTTCLVAYFALLVHEFRRAQEEFRCRLLSERQPMDECLYVHLVFAHDAYTSFLSFRRLFVAAAPAFSAPSASSTAPSMLISDSMPGALQWGSSAASSSTPARYPLSHLQHVLPTCPLFFGSVYVDFICYLLLAPQIFASARVRSTTHFLLPVLYLGQAMVAAVRALTPVATQGYLLLAPYLLIELHWILHVMSLVPNPLPALLELLVPLQWLHTILGSWVLDITAMLLRSWSSLVSGLYMASAPVRWINDLVSPMLEFIRQEMRALWGLSVLLQPLLGGLLRLQTELLRVWSGLTSLLSATSSLLSALMPSALLPARLVSLFSAVRSGATATAAVSSELSSSAGGLSRWRALYQSVLEFCAFIGKWKLLVDRIRLNVQVYYTERFLNVQDARTGHREGGEAVNPNLAVPIVQPLERSQSEITEAEAEAAEAEAEAAAESQLELRQTPQLTSRRTHSVNLDHPLPPSLLFSSPPESKSSLPAAPAFQVSPLQTEPPFQFALAPGIEDQLPSSFSFSGFEPGFQPTPNGEWKQEEVQPHHTPAWCKLQADIRQRHARRPPPA